MENTKKQIPVEKNKHYTIQIHDLGTRAEGIGKVDDFTIFVEIYEFTTPLSYLKRI